MVFDKKFPPASYAPNESKLFGQIAIKQHRYRREAIKHLNITHKRLIEEIFDDQKITETVFSNVERGGSKVKLGFSSHSTIKRGINRIFVIFFRRINSLHLNDFSLFSSFVLRERKMSSVF